MDDNTHLHASFERWANTEFQEAHFGDQRLTTRLIKITNKLAKLPECPINQACENWTDTKAAYRFFKNDRITESEILKSHVTKTVERSKQYKKILDIQDTCYMTYTSHIKTTGLGTITKKGGITRKLSADGLIMHTSFAVTTEGLPLGILDQKIYARPELPEEVKTLKKKSHGNNLPIEEKESMRWIESLVNSHDATSLCNTEVITVCDREADMYDFFETAYKNKSSVLVRAAQNRKINQIYSHSRHENETLWGFIKCLPSQGKIQVEVPKKNAKPSRTAILDLHFGSFVMNPPRNHIKLRTEELPDLKLQVIYIIEKHPPKGEEALEWVLLTNLSVKNFNQALEKVKWYCLRWRIETFHKILKSGLRVEDCRLGTAKRLMRYLTVMSVIAWRIFFVTLIARTNPDVPCTVFLTEREWKVLFAKIHQTFVYPKMPPLIKDIVRWIAQLGGFLARKGDGDPGPITLWRGLKRLTDLVEGAHVRFA